MIFAMVVLPVPGGPQKIMEGTELISIATRRMLPLPVRCSCPTNSDKVLGLIRSARGVWGAGIIKIKAILQQVCFLSILKTGNTNDTAC
jgi:hypothetical protein